jgi:hypothetical protein
MSGKACGHVQKAWASSRVRIRETPSRKEEEREREDLASVFVKGTYVSGCNHSQYRPKLYEDLGLWRGTINIQLRAETDGRFLIPNERIPGRDPIDADQDFLIRPCKLKGVVGYQILPIDKATGDPRGHHASKKIEISLKKEIELRPNEEIEIELQGFDEATA